MILWRTIEDHDTLFVLAEISHFLGIGVLAYKLYTKRSVAGACVRAWHQAWWHGTSLCTGMRAFGWRAAGAGGRGC